MVFEHPKCLSCGECCRNTEMILVEEDVRRLERLGFSAEAFSERRGGFLRLKNVDGRCVFYDAKSGKCLVYPYRPLGCRVYPLVFDEERGAVLDEDCPLAREFAAKGEEVVRGLAELERLLRRLEEESGYRVDWILFEKSSRALLEGSSSRSSNPRHLRRRKA